MNIYIYVCSFGFPIIFHCFWAISGVQTFFAGAFATVPGPGAEGGDQWYMDNIDHIWSDHITDIMYIYDYIYM